MMEWKSSWLIWGSFLCQHLPAMHSEGVLLGLNAVQSPPHLWLRWLCDLRFVSLTLSEAWTDVRLSLQNRPAFAALYTISGDWSGQRGPVPTPQWAHAHAYVQTDWYPQRCSGLGLLGEINHQHVMLGCLLCLGYWTRCTESSILK